MSANNGNGKHEDHDTLPAMPLESPEYAQVLYSMMLQLYQQQQADRRKIDARLLTLEAAIFGAPPDPSDEPTNPGTRS